MWYRKKMYMVRMVTNLASHPSHRQLISNGGSTNETITLSEALWSNHLIRGSKRYSMSEADRRDSHSFSLNEIANKRVNKIIIHQRLNEIITLREVSWDNHFRKFPWDNHSMRGWTGYIQHLRPWAPPCQRETTALVPLVTTFSRGANQSEYSGLESEPVMSIGE